MATAKRLYLYIVSAVGLGMLLWGAFTMLHLLFGKLGMGPGGMGTSSYADQANRESLSMAIALVVVGLPLWLIHWGLVERMVRFGPGAAAERASIVRSVFFAFALLVTLYEAAELWSLSLTSALSGALGANQSYSGFDYATILAIAIPVSLAWAYHAWIRARDLAQGTVISGAAAWVSRFYLYGAVLIGLVTVLNAIGSFLGSVLFQAAVPVPTGLSNGDIGFVYPLNLYSTTAWWATQVASLVVALVLWGGIWIGHWRYSERLRAGEGEQSNLERVSRVRLAFMLLVVLYGAFVVVGAISSILGTIVLQAIVSQSSTSVPLWYSLFTPAASAVPLALAWWLHRRRAISESAASPTSLSPRRIAGYVTALVGLYALASGLIGLLSTLVAQIGTTAQDSFGYSSYGDTWKYTAAWAGAQALAGLAIWSWPWFASQRRRITDGPVETNSSSRSFYLYAVIAVSVLGVAFGAAATIYSLVRAGLGLDHLSLRSEISLPAAVFVIATVLMGYHVVTLLDDSNPTAGPEDSADDVAPAAEPPAAGPVDVPSVEEAPEAPPETTDPS